MELTRNQIFFKECMDEFNHLFGPGANMKPDHAAMFSAFVQASATLALADELKKTGTTGRGE